MTLLDAPRGRTASRDLRTADRDARRARRRGQRDRADQGTTERSGTGKRTTERGRTERGRTERVRGTRVRDTRVRDTRDSGPAPAPDRRRAAVRQRIGTGVFVGLMGLVLLIGLLVMLLVNTSLAQGAFRVSELSRQAAELSQQEQQLTGLLALEENPARLEERARALGMVPQDVPAFLRLSDGTILGTPTPQRAPVVASPLPELPEPVPADPAQTAPSSDGGLLADRVGTGAPADTDSTAIVDAPAVTSPADPGAPDAGTGAEPSRSTWMPWTEPGIAP